jgi:sugar transferase (PEP-CTERM/EpsH1 system associated)
MIGRPSIVHVVHSLGVGGLENGVVNLVNTTGTRYRHTIVCMTTAGALAARLHPGIEVVELHKRPGHDLGAVGRLIRVLRRVGPAVVHSRNWATFDAVPAARLAGVPHLVHGEHGRDVSDPDGSNARRNRLRRLFSPFVSRFVTVSDDLRRWLVDRVGLPSQKVVTIHNGVDLARFSGLDRVRARDQIGVSAAALVLGTVGRLDPVKDQAGLIRAFGRLAAKHGGLHLAIVGSGPCRADLAALIGSLGLAGRAHLLGEREDVPAALAALDCFVLPSIAEGMSNTILEAMAIGLPVVATRVGGSPELVTDGVTGRLVAAQDVMALTSAIDSYLDDPALRARHGRAGRLKAQECFGLERMSGSYTNLYAQLVRSGASGEVASCAE